MACIPQDCLMKLCQDAMSQMCGDQKKVDPNYQKMVDPPRSPYGILLGDEKPDKGKEDNKNACPAPKIQICLPVCPPVCPPPCPPKSAEPSCVVQVPCATKYTPQYICDPAPPPCPPRVWCIKSSPPPPKVNRLLLFLLSACLPAGDSGNGNGSCPKTICVPCPPKLVCVPCPPPAEPPPPPPKPKDYQYRCESRELRAGILYTCCQCIKRDGLQHDCPRSPCQGRPACLTKPWPDCWPSGGCHGVDFARQNGPSRYNPCSEQRLDKKECKKGNGAGGKPDCQGNMMVIVCPSNC